MGLASVLNIVAVLPGLIQALTQLIQLAETLFSGSGLGSFKKEWVTDSLGSVVSTMATVSTGGQQQTWGAINENWGVLSGGIGSLVDFFAGVLYPKIQAAGTEKPVVEAPISTKPAWDRPDA